ncbi:hypothetical protein [Stenotrophomonas sp. RAC2]|nr:hypothetical protein [Stenotrophomonas sp. RAC2]MDV9042688.1 hypothetical protein [Stenotrophomonas sp. RAC2]
MDPITPSLALRNGAAKRTVICAPLRQRRAAAERAPCAHPAELA